MKLLLLTGATGFLGGAVLDKLLDNCNNINLLLLVRAPTPQAGLERIKENMRKFNVCEERLHALTNDNILPGDLNNPEAGNDSNLLIVFYVQIMPDDFVMQLHRF